METQLDYTEINALIKEFFEFNRMEDTLATFESEIRGKVMHNSQSLKPNITQVSRVPRNDRELLQFPSVYSKFIEDKVLQDEEQRVSQKSQRKSENQVTEHDIRQLKRQHGSVL